MKKRIVSGRYSATVLVGILVIGLVVGALGAYLAFSSSLSGTSNLSRTSSTSSSSSTVLTSGSSTFASNGPSLIEFKTTLQNTRSASLSVSQYSFGKGTLAMWVNNVGNSSIVLSATDVLFNGTFVSNTYLTVLDPTVTQVGLYAYMPPGSQVIAQLTPNPTPLEGQVATIQILNDTFTFAYGTSKT